MGAHLVMKKELSKMKKKKKISSDQAGLDGCPPGGSLRSPHLPLAARLRYSVSGKASGVNCGQRSLIG